MADIPIGIFLERKQLVTKDVAIRFMQQAPVLSTPSLIGFLEMTARDCIFKLLDPGYETVGTHVDIRHLAATPIGMEVITRAEVIGVSDRRITFKLEAWDPRDKIAEGTHERFIINVARFAARLQTKLAEASKTPKDLQANRE
jgi:fluoroacetyl-CoA thioesterase